MVKKMRRIGDLDLVKDAGMCFARIFFFKVSVIREVRMRIEQS